MPHPQTLFEHAGQKPTPGSLAKSVVVVVDAQAEYVIGQLPLAGVSESLEEIARLLERARAAGTPVIHVVHHGQAGGLFDPAGPMIEIDCRVAPREGEAVVSKGLPNAFTSTEFRAAIADTGRRRIILAGFMTHLCISATARSSLDNNMACTVVADACATRDLPSPLGGVVEAAALHENTLAALADGFAAVVRRTDDIPD